MIKVSRNWVGVSLERRIAVNSVMAIVGVCLIFGTISFTASLWMVHAHERKT